MYKHKNDYIPQIIASFIGILLFGLFIATYIPNNYLSDNANYLNLTENKLKFFTATYALILFTALILWLLKTKLKFNSTWYFYTLGFSSLIIYVKFMLSTNNGLSLTTTSILYTTVAVCLLYIAGLVTIYLFFQGRILKSLHRQLSHNHEIKFIFAAGLFLAVNFARIVLFTLTPLKTSDASSYLSSVFQGGGLLLSLILFSIILFVVEAFDSVKPKDRRTVFIVSLMLVIVYHIIWYFFVKGLINAGICNC
jgi:hypothetical protein